MKLSRILLSAFLMTVVSDCLTSCRDELCYNHFPSLKVSLSWEHEWERDYGMSHPSNWDPSFYGFDYENLRPQKPEWVNLVRFSPTGNRSETFLKDDESNLVVEQEEGQSVLLYNGDTEYLVIEDIASLNDARATPTARSRSSISYIMGRHPGLTTTNPPDVLYSAFKENLPLVGTHEEILLPIKMQPLVYTYLIRYEFDYGQEYVYQARGALGGMALSVYLRDGHTSEDATIVLFDCSVESYGCEARMRSFGVPGFPDDYYGRSDENTPERPYTLNLEVLLTNGKILEFNFDVADQMAKQPKGGVITVRGLRIEDEDAELKDQEGGFDVDLSGWGVEDVDLPVGHQ